MPHISRYVHLSAIYYEPLRIVYNPSTMGRRHELNIDKSTGFTYKEINKLLQNLETLEDVKSDDEVFVRITFNPVEVNKLQLALLWRNLVEYRKIPCKKYIVYPSKVQEQLDEMHFFDRLFGRSTSRLNLNPSIPIHFETFNLSDEVSNDTITKIVNNVTKNILVDDNKFHSETTIHMTELVNNAFDHTKSIEDAAVLCYVSDSNILDFCIVDTGQGFKRSFTTNSLIRDSYNGLPDHEIIERATGEGITCNPGNAKHINYKHGNAGIGLYFLNEFVSKHKESRLVVISNKGYYYRDGDGRIKKHKLTPGWDGTAIWFRTKLDQERSESYNNLVSGYVAQY